MRGTLILLPTLTLLNWGFIIAASPIPYPMSSAVERKSPDSTMSATRRVPYDTRGDIHIASVEERQIHNEDYGTGGDDAASPTSTQSASSAAPAASSTAGSAQPVARAVGGHRRRNTDVAPMYGAVTQERERTGEAGSSKVSRSNDAKMSGGWWRARAIPAGQLNQPDDPIPTTTPTTFWRRKLTPSFPGANPSDPSDQLPSSGNEFDNIPPQPMHRRQSTEVPGQPYGGVNGNTNDVQPGSTPVSGYGGANGV